MQMEVKKILLKQGFTLLLVIAFLAASCTLLTAQPSSEITDTAETAVLPATGREPSILVGDQDSDGKSVRINEVVSNGPGWLVVQAEKDGKPGSVIGYAPVQNGANENVLVRIDPELVTDSLYTELHTDAGEIGTYEFPGPDIPVQVNGQTVSKSFNVQLKMAEMPTPIILVANSPTPATPEPVVTQTHPTTAMPMLTATQPTATGVTPIVTVKDQDVKKGIVVVEEAISNGPGWLVIFTEQDGRPDKVIGFAPVKDGVNQNVSIKIDASQVTPGLYAILQTDAGKVGVFEYPGPDIPVLSDSGVVLDRFSSSLAQSDATVSGDTAAPSPTPASVNNTTPHVLAVDQPLRGDTIKVAEAVSEGPGWLGIHRTSPTGEIDSAIGSAMLEDGMNRDVIVKIDHSRATPVLIAMVHMDRGQIGDWEYPGPDAPLLVNGQMVMVSFKITEGLAGQDNVLHVSGGENPFIVDGQGMSLYISKGDQPGKSLCDVECRKSWLPLLWTYKLTVGENLDPKKLGFFTLPNGLYQVKYNNQPFYYYIGDNAPGDEKGQGIDGKWFLATP